MTVLPALEQELLRAAFEHVDQLGWKGKEDVPLFGDAAARGFDAILTLDVAQLDSFEECRALKSSGLHHIGIAQGRSAQGARGIARVIASVIVAMPYVLAELEDLVGQRVVELALLAASKRHTVYDPRVERSRLPYWH